MPAIPGAFQLFSADCSPHQAKTSRRTSPGCKAPTALHPRGYRGRPLFPATVTPAPYERQPWWRKWRTPRLCHRPRNSGRRGYGHRLFGPSLWDVEPTEDGRRPPQLADSLSLACGRTPIAISIILTTAAAVSLSVNCGCDRDPPARNRHLIGATWARLLVCGASTTTDFLYRSEPTWARPVGFPPGTARRCDGRGTEIWLCHSRSPHHGVRHSGAEIYGVFSCRLRSRTPGPPPFSSMNSIPAPSSAFRSAVAVDACAAIGPAFDSRRLIVDKETEEAAERSYCSQRSSARAARISSLVNSSAGRPI